MKIHQQLVPDYDPGPGCVLAVGNFDGVHLGHQRIFESAVRRAREDGLKAVLLTFSRHPTAVIRPEEVPEPLMTVEDRLQVARSFGFDSAFVLEFDEQMASLSPGDFVSGVLRGRLGTRVVVAGENWRFGRDREGHMEMLRSLGKTVGLDVCAVEPYLVDDLPVSSTRIRGALAAGDVSGAARLLGRPYYVRGVVVSGLGRGRRLGFPTVNVEALKTLVPGEGVYGGGYRIPDLSEVDEEDGASGNRCSVGAAAVSIGSSPTFEGGSFAVEAHLVGLQADLYGMALTVVFIERIRDQRAFPSAGDLAGQITLDVERSRELFSARDLEEVPL